MSPDTPKIFSADPETSQIKVRLNLQFEKVILRGENLNYKEPQGCCQPRSQSLSTSRKKHHKRDPGSGWSRVSQNLGDYK